MKTDEQKTKSSTWHDIRASLAISKGFSQALDSSFHALREAQSKDDDGCVSPVNLKHITGLEEDCLFCMSRLKRSLEQLESRIESARKSESGAHINCAIGDMGAN